MASPSLFLFFPIYLLPKSQNSESQGNLLSSFETPVEEVSEQMNKMEMGVGSVPLTPALQQVIRT